MKIKLAIIKLLLYALICIAAVAISIAAIINGTVNWFDWIVLFMCGAGFSSSMNAIQRIIR